MKQLLTAAIVLTAAVLFRPAGAQAQVEGPPDVGQLSPIQCPIEVPDSVSTECGALQVPENYANPGGASIQLPYIILHSSNPNHAPDPLIFTQGGPGYSSLESVWSFVNSPVLAERDVIIFEQRGNRYADPALLCDSSIWWEVKPRHTPCLDSIREKGVDISQYNTRNIVLDMVALRKALGYEQWNLYGSSFSTSLMLLLMQSDPDGIRSTILQSIKPPNETTFAHEADAPLRAIQQMFNDCAADNRCAAAYPELESQFFTLVKELNETPVEVEVKGSADSELVPLEIDGDLFIDWIIIDKFYQPAFPPHGIAYLPMLIGEVGQGNLTPLEHAAQSYWNEMVQNPQWSWGLFLAINCQQELPAAGIHRPAADLVASDKLDGFARSDAQRNICASWNLQALPPAATDYVESDIPVLVLAGSYDPVTPPEWSRVTADHLANSTYVEFAGHGHNVRNDNPCADGLLETFLQEPHRELDISCADKTTKPSFILPDDVYIAPGLANSGDDISIGDSRGVAWIETISLIGMLGMLLALVALLILGLVWLIRWQKREASRDKTAVAAYLLALLVIVIQLTVPLLTTRINQEYLGGNELLYSLGPSRDFRPAALLAWIVPLAGLLILALATMTLWAWLVRRWSRGLRVLTSLVVLASLPIVMLGLRWGLFTMLV